MRRLALVASMVTIAANVLLATACDSADEGVAAPPAGPPTLAEVCGPDGLFARLVTRLFDCTPGIALYLGSVESAQLAAACDGNLGRYVTDGTVIVGDRAALDACLAYVAGVDCEELDLDDPNPCEAALLGTVALDGPCEASTQCEPGAYCDETAGTTCGSCKPLGETGAACSSDVGCAGGRCRPGAAGAHGSCQPLAGNGEACVTSDDCRGSRICGADSRCGVTEAPSQGAACDNGTGFADALVACDSLGTGRYCKPAPGGTAGSCEPFATLGEACVPLGVTSGAAWCNFTAYEACRAEGGGPSVCGAPTIAELGRPCDPLAGVKCATGLRCGDHDGDAATPNECFSPLQEGAPCSLASNTCDLFLECSGATPLCSYDYTGSCPAQ